jgi:glycerophosphoryl diester phosphodiesterase
MKSYKFNIVLLLIALFVFSCSKEEKSSFSDIEIFGHGGVGFRSYINTTQENSFLSIQKAIEVLNADGVEVDIQIDSDGKIWLYHDQYLQTKTNCTGCFGDKNSLYINNCSYPQQQKIYSLEELIRYFSTMQPPPKISLQAQIFDRCMDYEKLAQAIIEIINIYGAYNWIQIESDSKELLSILKNTSNKYQLFLDAKDVRSGISICQEYGFDGLILYKEDITKEDVQTIKALGLKIGIYGVKNQWDAKSALEKHPNQIQTDNIELLHRIIYN